MATKKKVAGDAIVFQKRKADEVPAATQAPAHAVALVPKGESWRAIAGPGELSVIMTGPFEDVRVAMIDREGAAPREAALPRSWYWVEDLRADGARVLLRTARGDGRVYEADVATGAAVEVWKAPPRESDPGVRLRYAAGDRVIALVPPPPHNAWAPGPPPQGALHVLARRDGVLASIASLPSTATDLGLIREGAIAVTWTTYPVGTATVVAIDGERLAPMPFDQTKKAVLFAEAFVRADRAFVVQGNATYELANLDGARARALAG